MKRKGLVLLSGGLDSVLAAKLLLNQGIELEAVNFRTVFYAKGEGGKYRAAKAADKFGIKLHVVDVSEEYLNVIKDPKYGYGKNVNPCLDCRLFMFKKAKALMQDISASFIVTGEVLGERPMSQRKDAIAMLEKQSGLKGLIVRPLSAKYFEPTQPEKEGIVKRELLLEIKGRSRRPQIALAKELGIEEYLTPAGGCLLTDPGFARRMKDLVEHDELNVPNAKLLKAGRHFRVNGAKIVIGRNKEDNDTILRLAKEKDMLLKVKDFAGPVTLIRGNGFTSVIELAAALTAGYTKAKDSESVFAEYWLFPNGEVKTISVRPTQKSATGVKNI